MAERTYNERPWWVDNEHERYGFVFGLCQAMGFRVQTISLSGDPENPDVATVWVRDPESPSQQVELLDLPSEELVLENRNRASRYGVGAAHVAGIRRSDGSTRFAVVWEPVPPGIVDYLPEVITKTAYSYLKDACYESSAGYFARSIDVLQMGEDDYFPIFIATLWPHGKQRFGWMVADFLASDINQYPAGPRGPHTTALAVGYFPWAIVPYRPDPADTTYEVRRVLTLWRDVLFTPWSADPFARSAHREDEIRCNAGWTVGIFERDYAERIEAGEEALAISTNGTGGRKIGAGIYVPRGADPLRRKIFMSGIGNTQNAEFAPDRVPASLLGDASGELRRLLPPDLSSITELGARLLEIRSETGAASRLEAPEGSGLRAEWLGPPEARADLRSSGSIARGGAPGGGGPGPGTDRGPDLGRSPGLGRTSWRDGGLSTGPEWQAEEKPAPPGSKYHPIDEVMIGAMSESGARVGVAGVVRNGDGAYLRAYTLAEEGDPIAGPDDRIRWGSCSKGLMATVIATHYIRADAAGVDRSFAEVLEIDRTSNDPDFMNVTIREALRHETGISQDGVSAEKIYTESHNDAPAPDSANRALSPGDMTKAFQGWDEPLVTDPTKARHYNNFVYVALCELWSRIRGADFERYAELVKDMLPSELQSLVTVLTGAGYAGCRDNREVAYHTARPYVQEAPYDDVELILSSYLQNPSFGAGAGHWALSVVEMARIIRQLTRRGGNELWPTHAEKLVIANDGLGWSRFDQAFRLKTELITGDQHPVLYHNGKFDGANSTISHLFRGPLDSLDVVASFNTDKMGGLSGRLQGLLIDAAQEAELLGLWSPIDLLADP